MSIEQTGVVDFIGTDVDTNTVALGISDHLEWGNSVKDHRTMLQEKINSYLAYIESGEIYESYPLARGKRIVIQVMGKYSLSLDAERFYKEAGKIVQSAGCELKFKQVLREGK